MADIVRRSIGSQVEGLATRLFGPRRTLYKRLLEVHFPQSPSFTAPWLYDLTRIWSRLAINSRNGFPSALGVRFNQPKF